MVYGITENFTNQFQEPFLNDEQDKIEFFTEDEKIEFFPNNNKVEGEENVNVEQEQEMVTEENEAFTSPISDMNNDLTGENNLNESVVVEEEEEGFQNNHNHNQNNHNHNQNHNNKGIFKGGRKRKYDNHKLLLNAILFGLVFFIVSHPTTYGITKPYIKGFDKHLVHTIVFIGLYFIINKVIHNI